MTLRMSEAELARDLPAVLAKVGQGAEIVVERDHRAFAVIRPATPPGRKISECLARAKAVEERLGYAPVPDEDFAKDVLGGIDRRPGVLGLPGINES